jgi:hypothetical protein
MKPRDSEGLGLGLGLGLGGRELTNSDGEMGLEEFELAIRKRVRWK